MGRHKSDPPLAPIKGRKRKTTRLRGALTDPADLVTEPQPHPTGAMTMREREMQWQVQERFLNAFRAVGTVSGAARECSVTRETHYAWLRQDVQGYCGRFNDAEQDAVDLLEQEARRRALVGEEEPIWYQGAIVGSVRKKSDTLLMFLLNGRRADVFNYRQKQGESGPRQVGAGTTLPVPGMPDPSLDQRKLRARQLIARVALLAGLSVVVDGVPVTADDASQGATIDAEVTQAVDIDTNTDATRT